MPQVAEEVAVLPAEEEVGVPADGLDPEPGTDPLGPERRPLDLHEQADRAAGGVRVEPHDPDAAEGAEVEDPGLGHRELRLVPPVARVDDGEDLVEDLPARQLPPGGDVHRPELPAPARRHVVGDLRRRGLREDHRLLRHLRGRPPGRGEGVRDGAARPVVGRGGEDVALLEREASRPRAGLGRGVEPVHDEARDADRPPLDDLDHDGDATAIAADRELVRGDHPRLVVAALPVVGLDAPPVGGEGVGVEAGDLAPGPPPGRLRRELRAQRAGVHGVDPLEAEVDDDGLLGCPARAQAAGGAEGARESEDDYGAPVHAGHRGYWHAAKARGGVFRAGSPRASRRGRQEQREVPVLPGAGAGVVRVGPLPRAELRAVDDPAPVHLARRHRLVEHLVEDDGRDVELRHLRRGRGSGGSG